MAFRWFLLFAVASYLDISCSKIEKLNDNKWFTKVLSLLAKEEELLGCNYVVFVHDYDNSSLPWYMELLISAEQRRGRSSPVSVIVTPEDYAAPSMASALYALEENLWNSTAYISRHNSETCALYYFIIREDFETSAWYFNTMLRPRLQKDYFIILSEFSENLTSDYQNSTTDNLGQLEYAFKEGFENAVSVSLNTEKGNITVKNYCWFCTEDNGTASWFTENIVPENDTANWFSKFPSEDYSSFTFRVYSMLYFSKDKISQYKLNPGGVPVRFLVLQALEDMLNFTTTSMEPIAKTHLLAVLYNNMCDITLLRHMFAQHRAYGIFGRSYPYGFQSATFTLVPAYNQVRLNFFYFRSTCLFLFFFVGIAFFTFGVSTAISRASTRKLIGDLLPIEKLPVFLLPTVEFALPVLPSFKAARVSLFFWFFGLGALIVTYFGAVFNHLTSTRPVDLPQSFEELLEMPSTYWIVAPITTTSLQDLSYELISDDFSLVHSETECWRLTRAENFACLTLENETPDFGDVYVHKSAERSFLDFHHLNFQVKSVLRGKFDGIIVNLWETGFITYWESMWTHRLARLSAKRLFHFESDSNGTTYYDYRTRYSKLKLGETTGPFYFLAFALALCIGALIVETQVHETAKPNRIAPSIDDLNEVVTETQETKQDSHPDEFEERGSIQDFRYEALSPVLSIEANSEETLIVEVEMESAESDGNRSENALIQEIEGLNISTEEIIDGLNIPTEDIIEGLNISTEEIIEEGDQVNSDVVSTGQSDAVSFGTDESVVGVSSGQSEDAVAADDRDEEERQEN